MKLWKKLSLVCSGVLTVIVATCSTLLLLQSKSSILTLAYEQAADKQRSLASSFSEMAGYYADENDSGATNESLIRYCFSRFADGECVLLADDVELYSQVSLTPSAYLTLTDDYSQAQYSGVIDGRNICMVGSEKIIRQTDYSIYVVKDITDVYNDITAMIWKFALISVAGIALGVTLIALLVRRSMHPLDRLSASAKRIAAGNYAERAAVAAQDEVGTLAADFNAMAAAVETHVAELTETAERQRLFIGGVTHEFKTPLTTMMLNADTLQNAYLSEEEARTAVSYIQRQCKWLERLTQKLLQLITLKAHIKPERVSLPCLLERVRESTTETLRERETPLSIDCAVDGMELDADLMQSVLINLVDNASKASAPGQAVMLRAYDNVIEVADCGCGIPADAMTRIMEPFYMVDKSRSKKHGGTGLGLALVKEIVSAHGATLTVESEVGKGSVFRISFPR